MTRGPEGKFAVATMTTTSLAAGAVAVPRAMRAGARVNRRRSIARRRKLTTLRAGFLDDMGVGDLETSSPSSSAQVELANSIGRAVDRTYSSSSRICPPRFSA